jgi:hypothetical protein
MMLKTILFRTFKTAEKVDFAQNLSLQSRFLFYNSSDERANPTIKGIKAIFKMVIQN